MDMRLAGNAVEASETAKRRADWIESNQNSHLFFTWLLPYHTSTEYLRNWPCFDVESCLFFCLYADTYTCSIIYSSKCKRLLNWASYAKKYELPPKKHWSKIRKYGERKLHLCSLQLQTWGTNHKFVFLNSLPPKTTFSSLYFLLHRKEHQI